MPAFAKAPARQAGDPADDEREQSGASDGARAERSELGGVQGAPPIIIGEVAEWSMAVVLKTTEPETVPGVRIPLPPPNV